MASAGCARWAAVRPQWTCCQSRIRAWACPRSWRFWRTASGLTMARDLLMIIGAFVVASLLAGALGATNLGTALAFGQMALAATTVYVLLKR